MLFREVDEAIQLQSLHFPHLPPSTVALLHRCGWVVWDRGWLRSQMCKADSSTGQSARALGCLTPTLGPRS